MKQSTIQSRDTRGGFVIFGLRCGHVVKEPERGGYYGSFGYSGPYVGDKKDCVQCTRTTNRRRR